MNPFQQRPLGQMPHPILGFFEHLLNQHINSRADERLRNMPTQFYGGVPLDTSQIEDRRDPYSPYMTPPWHHPRMLASPGGWGTRIGYTVPDPDLNLDDGFMDYLESITNRPFNYAGGRELP